MLKIGRRLIVQQFLIKFLLSFLWHETILLYFRSSGKIPSFKIDWNVNLNEIAIDLPQSLTIGTSMLSHQYALSTFRFFIFSNPLLFLNSKDWSLLLLIGGVHWQAKYELNSSAFSEKFEITSPFTSIYGIFGIFLWFKNWFKIDQ